MGWKCGPPARLSVLRQAAAVLRWGQLPFNWIGAQAV
jgi:hypothetical protein